MSCHGRLLVTAVAAVRLRTSFRSLPRALFHQKAMMLRTFPEHFCTTFGTMFFTAWNAIPVWNTRVAFRTDTTPAAAHVVFPFKLDHCHSRTMRPILKLSMLLRWVSIMNPLPGKIHGSLAG